VVEPIVVKMVSNMMVSFENLSIASGEFRYPSSSHEFSEKNNPAIVSI
jgi:hypothetical protein